MRYCSSVWDLVGSLEPGLLPVNEAGILASAVRGAVTPHPFEMYGVLHPVHTSPTDGVAKLVGHLADGQLLSTELQHLWHEWQGVELAVLIQCRKNLGLASHLHKFADAKAEFAGQADFCLQCYSFRWASPLETIATPNLFQDVVMSKCAPANAIGNDAPNSYVTVTCWRTVDSCGVTPLSPPVRQRPPDTGPSGPDSYAQFSGLPAQLRSRPSCAYDGRCGLRALVASALCGSLARDHGPEVLVWQGMAVRVDVSDDCSAVVVGVGSAGEVPRL